MTRAGDGPRKAGHRGTVDEMRNDISCWTLEERRTAWFLFDRRSAADDDIVIGRDVKPASAPRFDFARRHRVIGREDGHRPTVSFFFCLSAHDWIAEWLALAATTHLEAKQNKSHDALFKYWAAASASIWQALVIHNFGEQLLGSPLLYKQASQC
ncbi:hypothetical protein DTO280E4_4370 [Paecilomyces variotii]|nr:hypothetical protein DTO280E4_4370 [Paecilomyces variotii]